MKKKGQMAVTDLILSVTIYLIIIVACIYLYTSYSNRLNDEMNYRDMMMKSFSVSESIIKQGGYPNNWNTQDVEVIGLAESDNVISTDRIANFVNLTYDEVKEKFGLGSFEYFIQIKNTVNEVLLVGGVSPLEDSACNESFESVTLRRAALWGGTKVLTYITIWNDDCTRIGLNGTTGEQWRWRILPG